MKRIEEVMESMTFEFFGSGKHKISSAMHLSDENTVFLDVRSDYEQQTLSFGLVHHMDVLHIPVNEISSRFDEIPRDRSVGIFCSSGTRSTMAYLYLRAQGFDNVRIVEGGYAELVEEFKPGKLLKQIAKKSASK